MLPDNETTISTLEADLAKSQAAARRAIRSAERRGAELAELRESRAVANKCETCNGTGDDTHYFHAREMKPCGDCVNGWRLTNEFKELAAEAGYIRIADIDTRAISDAVDRIHWDNDAEFHPHAIDVSTAIVNAVIAALDQETAT